MNSSYLTIVIPTFNEAERIGSTLQKIHSYLSELSYTANIIVVDNGSKDNTAAVVKSLIPEVSNLNFIQDGTIPGKGYAVSRGVLQASGKNVLFSDADLSTPIEEVEKLLTHLENGADIAIWKRINKWT